MNRFINNFLDTEGSHIFWSNVKNEEFNPRLDEVFGDEGLVGMVQTNDYKTVEKIPQIIGDNVDRAYRENQVASVTMLLTVYVDRGRVSNVTEGSSWSRKKGFWIIKKSIVDSLPGCNLEHR